MSVDVIMPQMGESIAEGTIVKWLKKVGDSIKRDEPLFEISTDKCRRGDSCTRRRRFVRDKSQRRRDCGRSTLSLQSLTVAAVNLPHRQRQSQPRASR